MSMSEDEKKVTSTKEAYTQFDNDFGEVQFMFKHVDDAISLRKSQQALQVLRTKYFKNGWFKEVHATNFYRIYNSMVSNLWNSTIFRIFL